MIRKFNQDTALVVVQLIPIVILEAVLLVRSMPRHQPVAMALLSLVRNVMTAT